MARHKAHRHGEDKYEVYPICTVCSKMCLPSRQVAKRVAKRLGRSAYEYPAHGTWHVTSGSGG